MRHARIALLACLILCARTPARADIGPVGPELPVPTDPDLIHRDSSVAADAGGRFVVVWTSFASSYYGNADGSQSGVFGRRFDTSGAPIGASFQVNTYTQGPQFQPRVGRAPSGEFVVAWTSGSPYGYGDTQDGSATGVFVQRYDTNGIKLGGELQANTYTRNNQQAPDIAVDAAGNFVVVWSSGGYSAEQDGDGNGVFGQRFGAAGGRQGSEFQVNTGTTSDQLYPAVASLTPGGFVVVWQSGRFDFDADGDQEGVFAQRFDATGARAGTEFQVNAFTTGSQYLPDVAGRPDGSFVVVWENYTYYGASTDGSGASVSARLFTADGTPLGGDVAVNSFTTGQQSRPRVAVDVSGNFVVTWDSGGYYRGSPDGSGPAVRAQHFSRTGAPLGDEVQVNTYTTGAQNEPAIAADGQGGFVITWQDYEGGASFDRGAIYAQRFTTTGFTPPIPLTGTTLTLKDAPNAAKRKLVVTSRDTDVDIGGIAGSIDDPTVHGGSLRIRGATFDATYALPAANWRAVGPGLGYEYRDPRRLAGPIVRVKVRAAQVLDVRGQGAALGFTLASNPRPVTLSIQLGAVGQRSCATFADGTYTFQPGRSFKAKKASAPAACPR